MSDRAVYFLSALYNQQQHNIDWLLSVDIVVIAAWCCPRCAGQVSVSASKCCTVRFPFEESNALLVSPRFRLLLIYSLFNFSRLLLIILTFFFFKCCWHLFFTILQLINISHQQSISSQLHDWNIYSPFDRKIIRRDRVHQQIVAKRADYFNNVMHKIILVRTVSISFWK